MLGVPVWVSQGDGVSVTGWQKALAAVALGSGAFGPPVLQGSVMGTCKFLLLPPPHPTHTPGQRVPPLSLERLRNRCFPMSLGRETA